MCFVLIAWFCIYVTDYCRYHRLYVLKEPPAPDQGQLHIGNHIGTDHAADLSDYDILNPHVAHLQGTEEFGHQEQDQGIHGKERQMAPLRIVDPDDPALIIFRQPYIGEIRGLDPDYQQRCQKHEQPLVSLSFHLIVLFSENDVGRAGHCRPACSRFLSIVMRIICYFPLKLKSRSAAGLSGS